MSALPYNPNRLQELAQEIISNVRELAQAGWTPATSSNFSERLDDRHPRGRAHLPRPDG